MFWRQSLRDGVYGPAGNLLRGSGTSNARHVGTEFSFNATWRLGRHISLTAIRAHFWPGRFIRETGLARTIDYTELTVKVMF